MKHPSFLAPLVVLVAIALPAVFTACIFGSDDDGGTVQHTYTGALADLERLIDTTSLRPRWKMAVDLGDEPILRGTCDFTGYLGDSVRVQGKEPHDALYTNTSMGGTRTAEEFRRNGVIFSMDSTHQMDTLTHYRADFTCTY